VAKDKLTGPLLIGAGVIGLATVGYFLFTKTKVEGGTGFDLQSIIDQINNLFKIKKPTDGDGGNGDGKGDGGGNGNGNGKDTGVTGSTVLGAAGDWGSGRNDRWKKTADLMKAQKVKVMLGLGDYSYTSVSDWQKVIDYLKKAGIMSKGAEGNHDSSSYAKTFGQPSFLYSFNTGPAVVIALNTESSSGGNVAFAEKILKSTKQPWKILIMHKPLYSGGSKHGEERSLANALKPIINKYGVQLVMYAHNHNYQRIVRTDHPKTVFICSGAGGESLYGLKGAASGTKKTNDSNYGFTKIAISGSTLKGSFIAHGGKTIDSWTQTATGKVANYAHAYYIAEPIGMRISI
jgi:acid phosphatase